LSDFKEIRNFPTDFLESLLSNLQEIREGGNLADASGQWDEQTNRCDENNRRLKSSVISKPVNTLNA